ncbi:hypothetical protein CAXC1_300007 [Candidatus Xenohaliotis californiensis]|uniref:Uncharacterized protein n=1 Tax=Candidatus Xenohaliotis californiensis TaxID=84677 RepID=A0ABP0ET11_9RICK|nr:hypothetical protein CAXC1_300007 [Candidatus Xenohaliotis californiensis]
MYKKFLLLLIIVYASQLWAIATVESLAKKIQRYHDIEIIDQNVINSVISELNEWLLAGRIARISLFCTENNMPCESVQIYLKDKNIPFRQLVNRTSGNDKLRIIYHEIVQHNKKRRELGHSVAHNMLHSMSNLESLAKSNKVQHYDTRNKH